MVLAIAYPSTAAGDPHRLSTQKIASIASDIRSRLFGIQPRPVDVAALIAKTARLVVNGKPITLSWGLDRPGDVPYAVDLRVLEAAFSRVERSYAAFC